MPDLRLMMWFTLLMMTVVSERPTPNCLEIDGESSLGCVCPIKFNKVRLGQSWKYRIHDHQTRLISWLETLLNKTYQLKIEPLIFFVHLRNLFSDISNNMSICQHRVMPSFVRNIFCASLMQLREGAKKRLTVFVLYFMVLLKITPKFRRNN